MLEYDFDLIDRLIDREISRNSLGQQFRPSVLFPEEVPTAQDRVPRRSSEGRTSRRDSFDEDDRRQEEQKRVKLNEDRRDKVSQSHREDCSVMVMGLHPQAGDKEVYEFFSKEAGKVRDVHVIRDQRTGKSKGVAYVEFYLQESVIKALACNGRTLHGALIRVKASGAEKNRAAEAQKAVQVNQQEKPIMLYILGLGAMPLCELTDQELREIFAPFGKIDYVSIGRCPYTGKSRGFAHIQFVRAVDAREAMACMNGFQIAGQTLQVGYLARGLDSGASTPSEYLRSTDQKVQLMENLGRAMISADLSVSFPPDEESGAMLLTLANLGFEVVFSNLNVTTKSQVGQIEKSILSTSSLLSKRPVQIPAYTRKPGDGSRTLADHLLSRDVPRNLLVLNRCTLVLTAQDRLTDLLPGGSSQQIVQWLRNASSVDCFAIRPATEAQFFDLVTNQTRFGFDLLSLDLSGRMFSKSPTKVLDGDFFVELELAQCFRTSELASTVNQCRMFFVRSQCMVVSSGAKSNLGLRSVLDLENWGDHILGLRNTRKNASRLVETILKKRLVRSNFPS